MTAVKVECDCGQRYAFDVEPIHGRMPAPVGCPACGADGTAKANAMLAQATVAASQGRMSAPIRVDAAPIAVGIPASAVRVAVAAAAPVALARPVAMGASVAVTPALPPPIPASLPPPRAVAPEPPVMARPRPGVLPGRLPAPKPARGKDGWNGPETGLHKLGQYVAFTPALLAALVAWHFLKIPTLVLILAVIVAVFGMIGGIINVWGRGPIWAGACVGLITSLSGFFAVTWWIHYRQGEAWWIEVVIGFVLGCMPGILVQYLLQKLVRRVSGSA